MAMALSEVRMFTVSALAALSLPAEIALGPEIASVKVNTLGVRKGSVSTPSNFNCAGRPSRC